MSRLRPLTQGKKRKAEVFDLAPAPAIERSISVSDDNRRIRTTITRVRTANEPVGASSSAYNLPLDSEFHDSAADLGDAPTEGEHVVEPEHEGLEGMRVILVVRAKHYENSVCFFFYLCFTLQTS